MIGNRRSIRAIHLLAGFVVLCTASAARAQRMSDYFGCGSPAIHNIPYDGRFTFARLMYTGNAGNCYYRGEPSWAHGYGYTSNGTAESNLMKITADVSLLRPHRDDTNVIAIDDPQLFHYPVAFLVEAAYLTLTPKEAAALRKYLLKGGFLIIDDSREDYQRGKSGWSNLMAMLQLVLPGSRAIDMEPTHPIFHSFFDINSFDVVHNYYDPGPPI